MALTVAFDSVGGHSQSMDTHVRRGTITFDSSYVTNGEPITAAEVGLAQLWDLDVSSAAGYVFSWDKTNGKLLAWYGDNNNAADGPLIEVPNATNLAAVTARFRAEGK